MRLKQHLRKAPHDDAMRCDDDGIEEDGKEFLVVWHYYVGN